MNIIKAGTRIHIGCHTGYVGMDSRVNYTLENDITEEDLNDICFRMALNNAESYDIYYAPHYEDEDRDDEEDGDIYSENIDGWWKLYDEKKHDGYHEGGVL